MAQPVPLTEAQTARATLLADFEIYLVKQRGLSQRTIYHALRFANRFLDHRFGSKTFDLTRLRAADAISFVQHVLARRALYRDKTVTTHLRIFLQYLFARGATATNLALEHPEDGAALGCTTAPAPVARWRGGGARLRARQSPAWRAGLCDAAAHGTARLRASEVIAIQLDDIDWRAGELLVRGKGKLHDRCRSPARSAMR